MQDRIVSMGSVIPLGDGLTGKSVLTQMIMTPELSTSKIMDIITNTKKSLNIEMEFMAEKILREETQIDVSIQLYVFPGQRQRYMDVAPSFDEILEIFNFLPALKDLSVLLLVHDTTRLESLKSLESWLYVALTEDWIKESTAIFLVSNKTDLSDIDGSFINQVEQGILSMIREKFANFSSDNVKSFKTSCVQNNGIKELKSAIVDWVANKGKQMKRS